MIYNIPMFGNKRLYHTSGEFGLGTLDPKLRSACFGGQKRGTYFFTEKDLARDYLIHNASMCCMYSTDIPRRSVKYPDWRLDLCFHGEILDDLPKYLRSFFFKKTDENGFVPLELPSQWGKDLDPYERFYSFYENPVTITGLKFKDDKCYVIFKEDKIKIIDEKKLIGQKQTEVQTMLLSSKMNPDYIGLADTLIDYLCQKDENFNRHYNRQLQNELHTRSCKGGALKYTGPEKIPVQIEPRPCPSIPVLEIVKFVLLCFLFGQILGKQICKNLPTEISKDKTPTRLVQQSVKNLQKVK